MLGIYTDFFGTLHDQDVNYCAYKSLNYLAADLDGARERLDLLVADRDLARFHAIAQHAGFFCASAQGLYCYVGLDLATQRLVMLDVCTSINFSPEFFKPYRLDLDFDALQLERGIVTTLSPVDYFPLMFYLRVTSASERPEHLQELKDGVATLCGSGEVLDRMEEKVGRPWTEISEDILNASDWKALKNKYCALFITHLDGRKPRYGLGGSAFLLKSVKIAKQVLGVPPYRIRRMGHLVAFVGVDGAGKTSTIDYLQQLEYFRYTGVRRMYFGNNEYRLPGLNWLMAIKWKHYPVRLLMSTLGLVDRQLRIFIAFYYMLLGNVVLADRYYHDDEIGRLQQRDVSLSLLKRIYKKIFFPKMLKRPDLSVFLDVSPEVAYQRKQDYSYDIMLEQNKLYKDYMYAQPQVFIANADAPQHVVYASVIAAINSLDRQQ
ncbi:hypothetical protein [Comamonas sp.]|uniref:hypothetical protein n=1 Tax=Comamonas sp. TaxID=34028 RepID=UPI00264740B7|nr:hypothetical protein [Comamonas sp.]MDN5537298.1 hypothetical protein [Comamonas sp.]